jgi:histidinol-phosphate phosphatase family protein
MKQAVILAGGLGTRLLPITAKTPKPMVDVNGKPFLTYVINDLRERGFSQFLILTGYLSKEFETYFQNDQSVKCLETDVEFTKGERLKTAQDLLDERFLLLYGDNYVPEKLDTADHETSDIVFTLIEKCPGNVSINTESKKMRYERARSADSNYVELGYMSVHKNPLMKLLVAGLEIEEALTRISETGRVSYRIVKGPYFSVSDSARLDTTRDALSRKKIIFLDRDGILNARMPKGDYVKNISECKFIDQNIVELKALAIKGFKFIIVSNQAGVARGMISESNLIEINNYIIQHLEQNGIEVIAFFYCLHGWDESCECRKPKPGMFLSSAKEFNILLRNCVYIGDDIRDEQAAIAAGCKSILVSENFDYEFGQPESRVYPNLKDAIDKILHFYNPE